MLHVFLNVHCGDGSHFYSSFAVCLVVYVKIPCGIAIKSINGLGFVAKHFER